MKAEPLEIADRRFLINRLIDQAPTHTLIREFFMNAQEAAALAPAGERMVKIYPTVIDGVPKLTFWNSGPGMDATELRRATDLSSSINKEMSLTGNFGIGAKVSGLTASPDGIRYRSCKDGAVHEVIIGWDEEAATYVRYPFQLEDGAEETVIDITEAAKEEGYDLSADWTEVVLFGEAEAHNTVTHPVGAETDVERSYVPGQIFRRFAKFKPGVEVMIDTSMTKGGGKDETGRNRSLKVLEDVVPDLPNAERVEDKATGVTVHYIHDPKMAGYAHSTSAVRNPATPSTTFCALVHKGERYELKNRKAWSAAAPNFGIPFGSKVLTIEIEIPDSVALPNQYRDGLTYPDDRSPIHLDHFAEYVREMMPDWVKEVIKNAHPPSDDNLNDIQEDLKKLLDEYRVPTTAFQPDKPASRNVSPAADGLDSTEETDEPPLGPDGTVERNLSREVTRAAKRASAGSRVRKAPHGAKRSKEAKALERVPKIEILTIPEEIEAKGIKGRAGKYYKDAHTLFINGRYSAIDRMAAELEIHFPGHDDADEVREVVLKAAQRFTAYRVGKATCYAISKRIADDWTSDDLDRATSPESLSLAADDFRQSLNGAKKWIRSELKIASAERGLASASAVLSEQA